MTTNTEDLWATASDSAAGSADDPWSTHVESPPAGADGYRDPYAMPATAGDESWINGPDAVSAPAAPPSFIDAPPASERAGEAGGFDINTLFDGSLPVQDWINSGLDWAVLHLRPVFQVLRGPVDGLLGGIESALQAPSPLLMIAILTLITWQLAGGVMAVATVLSLLAIAVLGIWSAAMVTLALVLTSLLFCILLGLPLGIWLARSDRAQACVRPLLDAMQTTPAFVYLVPVVMLFGIGNVPGVIVTIIFALPPLVRLTNLGIRQERPDLVEAARAYGASPWQLLTKVQMPLAMPSIMAGINQSLMLSLSMVVIASMIAVGGLGLMVLRGIGRLDMGLATVGGLGIVVLAILLDRITQAMGTSARYGQAWHTRGPLGLFQRLRKGNGRPATTAGPAA